MQFQFEVLEEVDIVAGEVGHPRTDKEQSVGAYFQDATILLRILSEGLNKFKAAHNSSRVRSNLHEIFMTRSFR